MNIAGMVDPGQDRIILELYAWISVDPKTQLEGLVGVIIGESAVQAITSSQGVARKFGDMIREEAKATGKKFYCVKFTTREVVAEL